jgi:bifunctional DNA-binding transcriptional regulator/antitoxin component of YhaV-PrlF toxin-antitoxin module
MPKYKSNMDIQTVSTTISNANQTAVPSLLRKLLDLKPGDTLFWKVNKKTKEVIIKQGPRKWGDYMSGLGKELWQGIDVDEYIREGREDRKIR